MAAPTVTFFSHLMLVMLLHNLTLTLALSDGINQLAQLDSFTVAKRVDDIRNTEVRDNSKDQHVEHTPPDPDDGVTALQEPDTATAKTYAEVKPVTAPHSDSSSPMTVSPYTYSIVISALPVAPTTLATFGVPGFSDSSWTPFTPRRSTTARAKTLDKKPTTTALPCVTTLATYGMSSSGSPSLEWTINAAVCPTTLATIAKNKES